MSAADELTAVNWIANSAGESVNILVAYGLKLSGGDGY